MAGKSDIFENDLLKLIFNNVAIGLIGDAAGLQPSAVAGNLYLAFHTADPGEAGSAQTTNETAYTGYTRMPVARNTSGFTVTNSAVNLTTAVEFPACTASPGAALTHLSIGTTASGSGKILYSGQVSPAIAMQVGTAPKVSTAPNLVVED